MDNARVTAVLEAAKELFREEESHGCAAVVSNAPQVIGEKLGRTPAEVVAILRMLHRKGKIGLLNGFGLQVTVARSQELLRMQNTVVTGGGKSMKVGKGQRTRTSEGEEPPEEAESSELLDRIAQLETQLAEALAAAEQAEGRRSNMRDARQRSDEAKACAEEALRRAEAKNREHLRTIETLQAEAAKVPDLERQVAELSRPRELPGDLAATIARLTGS